MFYVATTILLYAAGAVDKIMMLPYYDQAAEADGVTMPDYIKALIVILWPLVVAYEALSGVNNVDD